jgi:hypothetical protein
MISEVQISLNFKLLPLIIPSLPFMKGRFPPLTDLFLQLLASVYLHIPNLNGACSHIKCTIFSQSGFSIFANEFNCRLMITIDFSRFFYTLV